MKLAAPQVIESRLHRIALVETEIAPDFEDRYFDFQQNWDKDTHLGTIRTGEGDECFLWFSPKGAVIRGWLKGKPAVPPKKLFEGLPKALAKASTEKAFDVGGDSFALWCEKGSTKWSHAVDPDAGGAYELLFALDGKPNTFAKWAKAHHGVKLKTAALKQLSDGYLIRATPAKDSKLARESPDGDAEFKIVRDGAATKLVVGGKVQMKSNKPDLYMQIITYVREQMK